MSSVDSDTEESLRENFTEEEIRSIKEDYEEVKSYYNGIKDFIKAEGYNLTHQQQHQQQHQTIDTGDNKEKTPPPQPAETKPKTKTLQSKKTIESKVPKYGTTLESKNKTRNNPIVSDMIQAFVLPDAPFPSRNEIEKIADA